MSLYDDLPAPATNEENETTVISTKPESVGWKPRSLQPILRRPQPNKAKVSRSTTGPVSTKEATTIHPLFKPLVQSQPAETTPASAAGTWSQLEYGQKKPPRKRGGPSWDDEYEPHFPNDYDHWKAERRRQREERELSEEMVVEPYESSSSAPVTEHIPPAPNPNLNLNLTGEEAYLQRAKLSQAAAAATTTTTVTPPKREEEPQGSGEKFAYKMLKQYGWTEGQGLGKNGQGINAPLSVERTGLGFGVIVNTATNQATEPKPATESERASTVVLLTNMVRPGEVDDSLQEETAEECARFGAVRRCVIHEVNSGKVAKEEAVRIFVQFEALHSAQRALRELNGRFFAGRKVTARFFDPDRFDRLELAPTEAELGGH
ncbi:splicing factor [Basidiobolus meristosporus CBS 931.73]|uniref:Splicing factor n=1 Tax=Basidiobolus meristosporus CBS 931.73 TaxID=1314790 RepID=A0A1Y1WUY4_9FUNG|nr:splicing factor [Basidiobolus meristosporus CBS 931.73]|eukprot:ORX77357.1 splicing factor [Basidiobolus meristosporus CBS 931.73]